MIKLPEDLQVGDWVLPEGFTSDGCTMSPDFGIAKLCYLHDFMRRYKVVSKKDADSIFRDGIIDRADKLSKPHYYIVAWVYWAAVRITSPLQTEHKELPHKWKEYGYPRKLDAYNK